MPCPLKIAGTREIGGFRILRRSAKCTPRRKKNNTLSILQYLLVDTLSNLYAQISNCRSRLNRERQLGLPNAKKVIREYDLSCHQNLSTTKQTRLLSVTMVSVFRLFLLHTKNQTNYVADVTLSPFGLSIQQKTDVFWCLLCILYLIPI